MAFATAADLASLLQVAAVDTSTADLLLDLATAAIQEHLRQDILAVTGDTFTVESPDGPWLTLPQRPVTNVNSVAVNGNTVTDYSKIGDRLYRVYGWRWPSVDTIPPLAIYGLKSTVTVDYDHGYATIPDIIRATCLRVAARAYSNPSGYIREQVDDYAYERPATGAGVYLDDDDRRAIKRYRRTSFAVSLSR